MAVSMFSPSGGSIIPTGTKIRKKIKIKEDGHLSALHLNIKDVLRTQP